MTSCLFLDFFQCFKLLTSTNSTELSVSWTFHSKSFLKCPVYCDYTLVFGYFNVNIMYMSKIHCNEKHKGELTMELNLKQKAAYGIGAVGKDMVYALSASYVMSY